jgi:hypothetical protein
MASAFFLEYMAALSLGSIFSGTLFGMCRRQIFRLGEAAELTFTEKIINSNFTFTVHFLSFTRIFDEIIIMFNLF